MVQKHLVTIFLALALVFLGIAVSLYPGGSQASATSVGYSFADNYLCSLFGDTGINGVANPGQRWAFAGMFCMCVGFGAFFYRVAAKIPHRGASFIIRYGGVASFVFAFGAITQYHDIAVSIACVFGMLAMFYLFVFVLRSRLRLLKLNAFICLFFLYLNAFLYYASIWLVALPIAQKISYVFLITWVLGLEYVATPEDFEPPKKARN
ncbi:hypothetical protein [Emticicia fluvialis]|uniref:hypothetical protein n=1 Tax=Emticicia fluvialis TaxID=2974474 RepID=UPI002166ACC7|nr:hypothetical protein [Emticicia fluvialis]